MITEELLIKHGAKHIYLAKGDLLFNEGAAADFYYQIEKGEIKMFNTTEEGKEFTQGIFKAPKSFGEPPLLGDFKYPAAAKAIQASILWKLPKTEFIKILLANSDLHLAFTKLLSKRLAYKAMMGKEVSVHPPEHRILTLLQYLKKQQDTTDYKVELTRQQIAELTGLRVETVIRAIKKLQSKEILRLENRKIIM